MSGARAAYLQLIDSGHSLDRAVAAHRLWLLLFEQNDYRGATMAIELAHRFSRLPEEPGKMASARAAFQQVIDSDHPDHAPKAAELLRLLLGQ